MLKNVQLFITEIGCECNLAKEHLACPVSHRDRKLHALTNAMATGLIVEAYTRHSFNGYACFHYYNEPMLQWNSIRGIIKSVRVLVPHAKFLLWTNGTIRPDDPELSLFDVVKVTDYHKVYNLHKYYDQYVKHTDVIPWNFDSRIHPWHKNEENRDACYRPDIEVIIDHFGDMKLCCQDWRGDVPLGNVFEDNLTNLLTRRANIVSTIQREMNDQTPERCRRCANKRISIRKIT